MTEKHSLDPTAGGGFDPTLVGNPEGTIAQFSAEQRADIVENMSHSSESGHDGSALRLAPGKTLEEQCNDNYRYLNGRGISIQQFGTLLSAVKHKVFGDNPRPGGKRAYQERSNGISDLVAYEGTISQHVADPLTGKWRRDNNTIVVSVTGGYEDGLSLYTGFSDIEAEAAQYGLFGEVGEVDVSGTSRAEQILKRLEANELTRPIVEEHTRQQPEQPIALLEESSSTAVLQERQRQAEAKTKELTAGITSTVKDVKAATPKENLVVWNASYPQKGKGARFVLHEDAAPNEQGEQTKVWAEMTVRRDGTTEYKIIPRSRYPNSRHEDRSYAGFERHKDDIIWVDDQQPGTFVKERIPEHDPRARKGQRTEDVFVPLKLRELEGIHKLVVEAGQERVAHWQSVRPKRAGGFVTSLFRSRRG